MLRDEERDVAIDGALEWLQVRRREAEVGSVLEALLMLPLGSRVYDVIRLAIRWLPLNLTRLEA